MQGGGQLTSITDQSVSSPNNRGQHVFYGLLQENGTNATAAYLMDADGSVALVLKSGTTTDLGLITRVGNADGAGTALNNNGQVALILKSNSNPTAVAVLTPLQQ